MHIPRVNDNASGRTLFFVFCMVVAAGIGALLSHVITASNSYEHDARPTTDVDQALERLQKAQQRATTSSSTKP